MSLLTVDAIEVYYGDIQALWGVSLEVDEGEIVALVGANGAGKSTVLNTISGLLKVPRGKIVYNGQSIENVEPYHIVESGISLTPEGRQLWPNLDVLENLELGAFLPRARKEKEKTMDWVFEFFPRLRERLHQKAGTLSGGEQQMLAIGRALMTRPQLLMLDEASLGLAPVIVDELFEVIHQVNREKVAILLVEQDVYLALDTAVRGYVLETGKIVMEGRTADLLEQPHMKTTYLGL